MIRKIAFLLMLLVVFDMAQAWKCGCKRRPHGRKRHCRHRRPRKNFRKNVRVEKNSNSIRGGVFGSSINMSNKGKCNKQSNDKYEDYGHYY